MQIKRLEETLGQKVLNRGKGGDVELTPHGEVLLAHARQMLSLNDEVVALFRAPALAGTVRLGTPDDYAFGYLPPILKRFADTHPAVQVDVMCAPSGELVERLKAGDLDLSGVDVPSERVDAATRIDLEEWRIEIESQGEFFAKIGSTMPKSLELYRQMLLSRIEATQKG